MFDSRTGRACLDANPEAGAPIGAFVPCGCRCEPSFKWLCVYTEFGAEMLADQELRTQGLCTWYPMHFERERIRSMFPRYLLMQADLADDLWRKAYRTPGVVTVLGTRYERPSSVPAVVLETLWSQCAPNGVIYPAKPPPPPMPSGDRISVIPPGTPVKLDSGPYAAVFANASAICRWSSAKRVALLLRTLDGREDQLTVPRSHVGMAV